MSLIEKIIKNSIKIPDIEQYERFMFVAPHPDDIEIGAGATAAKLAAEGKKICFVVCTDGRYGTANMDLPPEKLIPLRKQESIASAKNLGIDDVRFLELSDGGFYTMDELEKKLARVIGDFKPDCIFGPDPDVESECHPDHLNVGNAVKHRAYMAPYKNIVANYGAEPAQLKALAFYYTAKPNAYIKVKGYLEKQLYSLEKLYPSQFPEDCEDIKTFTKYIKLRYHYYGKKEAFRVLGTVHMHCVPEIGL